jgi:peptidyl-prolyl cis-trans isomerase SurA
MNSLSRALREVLVIAGVALVAAPAVAQQAPASSVPPQGLRNIEVDRVAGVVATTPILFSEVLEAINFARAQGMQLPPDSAGQLRVAREFLGRIVDREVLITVAKDYKIEVTEVDVSAKVEKDVEDARSRFNSEAEFRSALEREGFGTPEEYRKKSVEAAIRDETQRRAVDSLKSSGRMAPANVTEKEVAEAFERLRGQLPPRPATVGFRQIVLKLRPRPENVLRARELIDSLRIELEKGANFDTLAMKFSQDGSAERGGDLDWQRRGVMVPQFEQMMFALLPGRISPIVETQFGFHVIRVDRVRAGEVRARHILIKPVVDSIDLRTARALADTVLDLWKKGTPYDSLVARYHDFDEERSLPEGIPRDSLPAEYRVALRDIPVNGFTEVFALPDRGSGLNKWAVGQVLVSKPAGTFTLEEYQDNIRRQLREEKSIRRTLDNLRREMYVSLRL